MNNLILRIVNRLMRSAADYEVRASMKSMKYCGDNVKISPKAIIWGLEGISIDSKSEINSFTHIFASGGVTIGQNVLISSNCSISSVTHVTASPRRIDEPLIFKRVVIADNVWIGMNASILPGVTIGANSVVGAGSVVNRDVPENVVVAGNPAKIIKTL